MTQFLVYFDQTIVSIDSLWKWDTFKVNTLGIVQALKWGFYSGLMMCYDSNELKSCMRVVSVA